MLTIAQTKKDFESIGLVLNEFDANNFESFENEMQSQLENLAAQPSKLQQLVYQIDLPESAFLLAMDSDNKYGELTKPIIRREAFKVYLRTLKF